MFRLIFLILITTFANGSNIDIKKLQYEFTRDVIETNIYRKRFNNYLNEKCGEEFACIQKQIGILKSWDTVQNDKNLWNMHEKRSELFENDKEYWHKIKNKLLKKDLYFDHSQFVSVIDLDKQLLIIILWDQTTDQYHYIGKDYISSGDMKREAEVKYGENHYFKTPPGIFKANNGWRSDGKPKDDNITLGYGKKGRFIFYFGEQDSIRYNTFDKEKNKIYDPNEWQLITDKLKLALHAHKSSKPMGEPNSHGCVRTSDEMNRFLDNYLVLHKNMLKDNEWAHSFIKAPKQPKNPDLAGEYLIIFDKIN